MNETAQSIAEACQLINRLWLAMDQFRHDDVLTLLTTDCRWKRDGGWQEGTEEITASLKLRPPGLFIRHIQTNLVVEDNKDGFFCRYYLAAYATLRKKGDSPHIAEAPIILADASTRCLRQDGVLRISEIAMDVCFLRPTPAT